MKIGERFALLSRHELGEAFGFGGDEIEPPLEDAGALLCRLGRPSGKRAGSGIDGADRVLGAEVRDGRNLSTRRRIVHGKGLASGHPLSVYQGRRRKLLEDHVHQRLSVNVA